MLGRRWDYSTEINLDFRVTPRSAKTEGLRSIVKLRNTEYTFRNAYLSKNTHVDKLKSRIISLMGYLCS